MTPLRLGWLRLTGCSGCQLSLLDAAERLASAAPLLELVAVPLLTSQADDGGPLDVALVEGCLSTPEELEPLQALRRRAPVLVAVGACAVSGGIPALAGDRRGERCSEVYGAAHACRTLPPQPVENVVRVDLEIPGCPPESEALFETLAALARGALPAAEAAPVCFECRRHERPCLLFETVPRRPCFGPVTRGGCQARCPRRGIPCEGCRGDVRVPRDAQLAPLLRATGVSEAELQARRRRFGEGGR